MFLTLEGVEGSGKSSVLDHLARHLEKTGQRVLRTREPGGSSLGGNIRPLLLREGQTLAPLAELFLFQADRAQHVAEVILPALESGIWALSDRYADSTIAYQGYGRGLDVDMLREVSHLATGGLWPDLTLLLDLPPEIGLARARRRNDDLGLSQAEGRFEAEELAFHHRVRDGFLALAAAEPHRYRVLDSSLPLDAVLKAAWAALTERVPELEQHNGH